MFISRAIRFAPVLIASVVLGAQVSHAGRLHLAWDPSPDADLQGYKLFYGTSPGNYSSQVDVGNATDYVMTGLTECSRYYFSAKAYDLTGNLSDSYSNELRGMVDPSVTTLAPAAAERGQALTVTVTGSSFDVGASLSFSDRINVYSTAYVNCRQLRATISISGDATLGPQSVWVVNPDGSYGSLPQAFQVQPVTTPFVTAVTPAPGSRSVPVSVRPSVTFSERMNPLSIKPSTVMLLRPDGTVVPQAAGYPALDVTGKIVTIVPAANLQYGTMYRVQILGGVLGVRDSQGTALATTIIYGLGFLTVESVSNDAPQVVETRPSAGAADVPTDLKPTVTFSKELDPLTVTVDTVQLFGPDGGPVPQSQAPTLDFSGRVATLELADPLQYNAVYFLRVEGGANGVHDVDGLPIQQTFTQTPGFSTPAGPDVTPPNVRFTDPPDGTRDVPAEGLINILFSEAMDPASLGPGTVQLLDSNDQPVLQAEGSPALGDSGTIVTVVPSHRLAYGTVYRIRVLGGDAGVRDVHGNTMLADYASSKGLEVQFAPGTAPVVLSVSPTDGSTDVPSDIHPSVTFSESMDPTSITVDSIRILDSNGQTVPQADGSPLLEASGTIVTVIPAGPLTPGEVYFLEVIGGDAGVLDDEGTPMDSGYSQGSGFVISLGDTQGPLVIYTNPENDESHVDRHVHPRIYLNEEVDPDSVTQLTIVLVGPDDVAVEQDEDSPSLDSTGTILKITPKRELRSHENYRIQVMGGPQGLKDLAGNPMASTFTMEDGFDTR